ncbi:hypothetical protein QFC24_001497 [Naganishia onofrii]|uniref:Uncharacterized protein n=1 Tax=Naganishia onofrii TaxID=1851511 RepID=A0ACC2XV77_9TREE|nr:hypothetical protein QFC24_001497 [Naganishia onofrii]
MHETSNHSDDDKDADDVCSHDPAQSEPVMTIDLDRTVLAVTRPEETVLAAPQVDKSISSSSDSGGCSVVYSDHDPIKLSFGPRPPASISRAETTSISSGSIFNSDSSRSICYSEHYAVNLSFGSRPPPSIAPLGSSFGSCASILTHFSTSELSVSAEQAYGPRSSTTVKPPLPGTASVNGSTVTGMETQQQLNAMVPSVIVAADVTPPRTGESKVQEMKSDVTKASVTANVIALSPATSQTFPQPVTPPRRVAASSACTSPPRSSVKKASHPTTRIHSEWVTVGFGRKNRKSKGDSGPPRSQAAEQNISQTPATPQNTSSPYPPGAPGGPLVRAPGTSLPSPSSFLEKKTPSQANADARAFLSSFNRTRSLGTSSNDTSRQTSIRPVEPPNSGRTAVAADLSRQTTASVTYYPTFPSGLAEPMSPFSTAAHSTRPLSGTLPRRPLGTVHGPTNVSKPVATGAKKPVFQISKPIRGPAPPMPKRPTDAFNAANVAPVDVRIRVFNDRGYHPDGTPKNRRNKRGGRTPEEKQADAENRNGMGEMM